MSTRTATSTTTMRSTLIRSPRLSSIEHRLPTHSAGVPRRYRQGAEFPSERMNNNAVMRVTSYKKPASAVNAVKMKYEKYKR